MSDKKRITSTEVSRECLLLIQDALSEAGRCLAGNSKPSLLRAMSVLSTAQMVSHIYRDMQH